MSFCCYLIIGNCVCYYKYNIFISINQTLPSRCGAGVLYLIYNILLLLVGETLQGVVGVYMEAMSLFREAGDAVDVVIECPCFADGVE